jgi:hypothetical protein
MPHKNSTLGNGMNKADLLKGFLLGISGSVFCLRFHNLIYSYDFIIGIQIMKSHGSCNYAQRYSRLAYLHYLIKIKQRFYRGRYNNRSN